MSLDGMYDLQLMKLASRDDKEDRKFLSGLENCINEDLPGSSVVKHRWLKMNDSTNKYLSSSLNRIARPSMKRIELFPALWNIYRGRLGIPGKAFWLHSARVESWQRVQASKEDTGRRGRQDWGPKSWWVQEMKRAAIDDWEDDLRMELLAGDMELNDDAEWVLKREEDDWDFEIMNWRGQS
jgi:exonuclease 3'-5' domain-containing protein 1